MYFSSDYTACYNAWMESGHQGNTSLPPPLPPLPLSLSPLFSPLSLEYYLLLSYSLPHTYVP